MIIEKAYAKINLALEVKHKRADAYHELDMVLMPIDLYDEVRLERDDEVSVTGHGMDHIRLKDNLAYKAAMVIKETLDIKKGVKINIEKNIPEMAGLAGGSADAAAVLRGLNELWELGFDLPTLAAIGEQIGSDVPFCVYNQLCRVRGRGEIIECLPIDMSYYVVLIHPNFTLRTKEVFQYYEPEEHFDDRIGRFVETLQTKRQHLNAFGFNDLERAVQRMDPAKYEIIENIKNHLLLNGAVLSLMSGSGSTVYGLFHRLEDANEAKNRVHEEFSNIQSDIVQTHQYR